MSLDVYLIVAEPQPRELSSGIFIREDGRNKEISAEEWNRRNPDREPVRVVPQGEMTTRVFSRNITHNLGLMAKQAGIYEHLWRPEELGITQAFKLIAPLQKGLDNLLRSPEYFKTFNPANGWGNYEGLVEFVTEYLVACAAYPEATIEVSR